MWFVENNKYETALERLREIIDAMLVKFVPNFRVSLCYDEANSTLYVSEPYSTGTRLPDKILLTLSNSEFDLEGVVLDDQLPAGKNIIIQKEVGGPYYASRKAYEDLLKDELYFAWSERLQEQYKGVF